MIGRAPRNTACADRLACLPAARASQIVNLWPRQRTTTARLHAPRPLSGRRSPCIARAEIAVEPATPPQSPRSPQPVAAWRHNDRGWLLAVPRRADTSDTTQPGDGPVPVDRSHILTSSPSLGRFRPPSNTPPALQPLTPTPSRDETTHASAAAPALPVLRNDSHCCSPSFRASPRHLPPAPPKHCTSPSLSARPASASPPPPRAPSRAPRLASPYCPSQPSSRI